MQKEKFGVCSDGKNAYIYTINNSVGMIVKVSNFGGAIISLYVKDKNGELRDVVLGFDTLAEYEANPPYFGTLIGRCANRIKDGKFCLNEKEYQLDVNNEANHLHGGFSGFHKRLWNAEQTSESSIKLTLFSANGDQKYPGNLIVSVLYTVTEDNALEIKYQGFSDRDTLFNMTYHAYFNLAGQDAGDILDHELTVDANTYIPIDDSICPTGEIRSVEGTPFDFRAPKRIGQDIDSEHGQIMLAGGYDHNYVLNPSSDTAAATAFCEESGIRMVVYTDMPGAQLYTGNSLDESIIMKGGRKAQKHKAFCLETQYFPDAINHSHFDSPVIKAGDLKEYVTRYKFSVKSY